MTTQLTTRPRLLTVAEYQELGEPDSGYSELVEGRVVITPSPLADHNHGGYVTARQLEPQLPSDLEILLDIDVDLGLAAPDEPGFCRRPDLIVVRKEARLRQRCEGGLIRASDVVVVQEFVSPGSRRTDHVIKRGEYADAGIPHYWIVDLTEPVSLLAYHLAGEFGAVTFDYADSGAVTGTFRTSTPFPAEIDLDALL